MHVAFFRLAVTFLLKRNQEHGSWHSKDLNNQSVLTYRVATVRSVPNLIVGSAQPREQIPTIFHTNIVPTSI